MIVKYWTTQTHYRSDAQEIHCSDAHLPKDGNLIAIFYLNGNQTFLPINGMTRLDIIRSTDKSCPTCFRLLEEDKNDKE